MDQHEVVGVDCFNDNSGRAQKLDNLRHLTDWNAFEFVPIVEWTVDPDVGSARERRLATAVPQRASRTPLHPGRRPGSYAPAEG